MSENFEACSLLWIVMAASTRSKKTWGKTCPFRPIWLIFVYNMNVGSSAITRPDNKIQEFFKLEKKQHL